ncbi:unnamed protein product [Paramecium pentaurelia]|uniref:PSI domain-containing protein n=1 Tax=Paramecium pentaurelia TaxID=43138 RepID=A0A8S1UQ32_9CILI|nr:unnamed protein product [Paramecium pentaurelia]
MTYRVLLITLLVYSINCNVIIRTDARCVCKQWKLALECANDQDCIWNSNTKTCEQEECSSIKSQSICSADEGCQYRDGKCENFTKCEDLKGKTINECRFMSTNCRESNGEHCLPNALERKCSEFKNEGECLQGQDGFCLWLESKCILWSNCVQAITKSQCEMLPQSCDWSETLKFCLQKQCSEIDHEYDCIAVQEGPNSHLYQVCEWNYVLKQCESSIPDILTFDTCASNTLQAYHWSSSNANEGFCEQCLSPNVQKPTPKHCLCNSISSQTDCQQNQTCIWKDGECEERKCTEIDPPQACIQQEHCAWFSGSCVEFTQCENYKAFSNLECQSINKKCLLSDTLETCTSKYQECKTHKTDDKCNGSKDSKNEQCYWDEKTNTCQVWTQCSQQKQATYCDYSGACLWDGECKQITCKLLNQHSCTHYLTSPNSKNWKYCMLLDTCQDLNPDLLSKDECYAFSYGLSTWNSSECQLCKFPDDYTSILSFIGMIIITML